MIRNWKQHSLFMDFSSMKTDKHGQPSDIDMFYLGKDNTLILGEIKHESGEFTDWQRRLYSTLADGWKGEALILFITHSERVEDGKESVDVGKCYVREYYWHGRWWHPKFPTQVYKIIDKYS